MKKRCGLTPSFVFVEFLSLLLFVGPALVAQSTVSSPRPRDAVTKLDSTLLPVSHRDWRGPDGRLLPFKNKGQVLDFLENADVVSMKRVGEGINKTRKVLLEKDGLQLNAAFRDVKADQYLPDPQQPSFIRNHRDDCFFEVAAYRLSEMLGLGIVPPTVRREIRGRTGSLQLWIEDAMMERERREKNIAPPDEWYWMAQMLTVNLFDNLVGNLDRHQGNLLIDRDWTIWLIDHTQAFRRYDALQSPEKVAYCEKRVWERLQSLDEQTVRDLLGDTLREPELKALLRRRDLLVKHIRSLIDARGADKVLFSL